MPSRRTSPFIGSSLASCDPVSATSIVITSPVAAALVARRVPFSSIPRGTWDRLFAVTAHATPFSRWTFHRAWWDAYGEAAHEDYVLCTRRGGAAPDDDQVVAIVPLMHRHAMELTDPATHTSLRHEPPDPSRDVPPTAKVMYFGASYHADYATVLCATDDLAIVTAATVDVLAAGPDRGHGSRDWDVVDLRRLRSDDPALGALESAFRARSGWSVAREVEDVCPVLDLDGVDWEGHLQRLTTKDRHEIRRKMRRVEAAGAVRFELVEDPVGFVDSFIEMHQARWGEAGLFPDTVGGRRSRRFLQRLAELEGPDGVLRFGRLIVGSDTIFVSAGFHDRGTVYFYNAGSRPEARHLSPGVVGVAWYLRRGLEAGYRRFDFLRGDEPYKYQWGATDEPIHRIAVARTGG
jgi:hypothetical protein